MLKCIFHYLFILINIIILTPNLITADSSFSGEEIIVSLKVNYEDLDTLPNIIRTPSNDLLILLDHLKLTGVKEEYLETAIQDLNNVKYVNLNNLEQIQFKFDEENLALDINFTANKMKLQKFKCISEKPEVTVADVESQGAFLNYDLTFSHSDNTKYMSRLQDLNHFSDQGILYYNFFVRSGIPNQGLLKEKKLKNKL